MAIENKMYNDLIPISASMLEVYITFLLFVIEKIAGIESRANMISQISMQKIANTNTVIFLLPLSKTKKRPL
jgi:hypothetical protein